ncbi:acyl carrier protein [Saitoella complicata NRRL Y-17804]|uniref:acyl carrier protein n=1 Tax=Saitoella complicata (strain BCRC 22490 / CBS 7301 / JCM 7358 / NBRC 10748 / NRRL Y-17804) TaxID=698492 RepID=UPI000867B3F9|nr:acyl carrier protein [Saitoella complicata NRRL Y-17804]ODQ51367.1 acyl carrier protein [Saitoella complicata NRRL Y-17804]
MSLRASVNFLGAVRSAAASSSSFRIAAAQRFYSSLGEANIESRVLDCIKSFDKINQDKISNTASFEDLGLDSLDVVEVVLAIEEEFSVEIPDKVADGMKTVKDAIDYLKTAEAK